MTTDTAAQLAILANALTEIVDLATAGPKTVAPPGEVLARAGDIAAEALAAAATYGRLPPFAQAGETPDEAANSAGPGSPLRRFNGLLAMKPPGLSCENNVR
jgi:hypothetical protein